jgi:hypothetical protein
MAVDLGFAGRQKKSCGLAWIASDEEPQTERANFGQCVEKVAAFLSKNASSVLIVEAPLSGLFDSSGSPKGRAPFEKVKADGTTDTRYWYVGPGAAVGLGAAFFFSQLSQRATSESNVVNVVEGFISFKTRSSDDVVDALALLKGLCNSDTRIHNIEPEAGERCTSMLGLVGLVSQEHSCPAVMVVTV